MFEDLGKFSTIVIDPPWEIKAGRSFKGYCLSGEKQLFNASGSSRNLQYKTMSIEEIKSIPINKVVMENAHLYLWVINRYVEQSYSIVRSWGFEPSTLLVWAKNVMGGGLGGTYGISTEYVLFCRKGFLKSKDRISGTWFNWKRPYFNGKPKHSAKPEEFQNMVEKVSPGPYLELFARRKREGWTVWGDQI